MKTETILKRIDGAKVRIVAEIIVDYTKVNYKVEVYHCPSNKRKFMHVDISDNYAYRRLPSFSQEREDMFTEEQLKYVSRAEIYQAKLNLWASIKP